MHAAVDTLGHLLALHVTAAEEQHRAQMEQLAAVQRIRHLLSQNLPVTRHCLSGTGYTDNAMFAPAGISIAANGQAWMADNGTNCSELLRQTWNLIAEHSTHR